MLKPEVFAVAGGEGSKNEAQRNVKSDLLQSYPLTDLKQNYNLTPHHAIAKKMCWH